MNCQSKRLRVVGYQLSVISHYILITVYCLLITAFLSGCAHTIEITDQTVKADKMKAGQAYTAPMDGWFVSDEGVSKILQAIEYYKYKWQECEASK